MTNQQIVYFVIGLMIGFFVWAVRRALRPKVFKPIGPQPCEPNTHLWRGVAAPYAMQCRKCGATRFALDSNGNFPDGLPEYFEYVSKRKPERVVIRQDLCHCGAQMVETTDGMMGPIYLCEVCTSWRKIEPL
jgi:hypothetical protein